MQQSSHSGSPRPNRAARRAADKARPRTERRRKLIAGAHLAAAGLTATGGLGFITANPASAATFDVTTTADSGDGSLRDALVDANNAAGPDTITFDPALNGQTISLTSQILITDAVSIVGPGATNLTVESDGNDRIFYLYNKARSIAVTISGLELTNGSAFTGGAVRSNGADLTLQSVRITDNTAQFGGGVYLEGTGADLVISDSLLSGNTAQNGLLNPDVVTPQIRFFYYYGDGGAVATGGTTGGTVAITDTQIINNIAAGEGGGVFLYGDSNATITDSTISGNSANSNGGGIAIGETQDDGFYYYYLPLDFGAPTETAAPLDSGVGSLTISGSTISDNSAFGDGGGLHSSDIFYGDISVGEASVISDNSAFGDGGGARFGQWADVSIDDTIISENQANKSSAGGGISMQRPERIRRFVVRNDLQSPAAEGDFYYGLEITNSTISGNSGFVGGGVHIDTTGGDVHIADSEITGNEAYLGGGVGFDPRSLYFYYYDVGPGPLYYVADDVTIERTTISGNEAYIGGGVLLPIVSNGEVTVTDTTVADNDAYLGGGLLLPLGAYDGTTVERVTVSGNTAEAFAGVSSSIVGLFGLFGDGPIGPKGASELGGEGADVVAAAKGALAEEEPTPFTHIVSSTIADNHASDGPGGGIATFNYIEPMQISHSTISGNTAGQDGAGVMALYGPVIGDTDLAESPNAILDHTIVADNEVVDGDTEPVLAAPAAEGDDNDVTGAIDASYSLIEDVGSASITDSGGNVFGQDPELGALADNGGSTKTQVPGDESPAIDAGDPAIASAPATDQRGQQRVDGDAIDIGAVETTAVVVPPVEPPVEPPAPECSSDFTAIHPIRALNTRLGQPVGPKGEVTVDVTGLTGPGSEGVPETGVSAVAINVTATGASGPSFVTVYPDGEDRPTASNLNTDPGSDVANLVLAKVGDNGQIRLYNDTGTTDLVVDVLGWFGDCGEYRSLSPSRVLDTRGAGGPLAARETRPLTVLGTAGVPATDVAAVVMNVTSTESNSASFVSVWPKGTTRPTASNLNTEPGSDVANLVIVAPGEDGAVNLYNENGTTEIVVDLLGYYTIDSVYMPITPTRIDDTRTGAPMGPASNRDIGVAGTGLPVPGTAASVIVNVTSTQSSQESFVTAHATGTSLPPTSNLNTEPGQDVANLAIAQIGEDRQVRLYNNAGTGHLATDVVGYFADDEG